MDMVHEALHHVDVIHILTVTEWGHTLCIKQDIEQKFIIIILKLQSVIQRLLVLLAYHWEDREDVDVADEVDFINDLGDQLLITS